MCRLKLVAHATHPPDPGNSTVNDQFPSMDPIGDSHKSRNRTDGRRRPECHPRRAATVRIRLRDRTSENLSRRGCKVGTDPASGITTTSAQPLGRPVVAISSFSVPRRVLDHPPSSVHFRLPTDSLSHGLSCTPGKSLAPGPECEFLLRSSPCDPSKAAHCPHQQRASPSKCPAHCRILSSTCRWQRLGSIGAGDPPAEQ
jgi:hypothetical protein